MARLFAKTSILACLALTNLMAQTNNPAAGYWFKRGINDENVRNRLHAFSLALQYDPDFVEAQYQLARAFGEQKDDKKAELNCLKAYSKTQSQPVHDTLVVQILVELGNIYERLAKWQEL
jgi:tetratricopeptide (TPR) repeat protein